jgi:hypothetical protein
LPLSIGFRVWFYVAAVVLFASGAAWLLVDPARAPFEPGGAASTVPLLLAVHGGAAMVMLVLLGALLPLHVRIGWRNRTNRAGGAIALVLGGLLVGTAFGLYYVGAETLRGWISDAHIVLGLGAPLLVLVHVVLGKRATRAREAELDDG